jgi:hypothetical protein
LTTQQWDKAYGIVSWVLPTASCGWYVLFFYLHIFHLIPIFFQITLGYNEQLYQAIRDLVALAAVIFAGNESTVLEIIAGILVVLRKTKQYREEANSKEEEEALETEKHSRPEWIQDDAPNGPEWLKVKRYATLAMGMYYWPTYLFLSPLGPLV